MRTRPTNSRAICRSAEFLAGLFALECVRERTAGALDRLGRRLRGALECPELRRQLGQGLHDLRKGRVRGKFRGGFTAVLVV